MGGLVRQVFPLHRKERKRIADLLLVVIGLCKVADFLRDDRLTHAVQSGLYSGIKQLVHGVLTGQQVIDLLLQALGGLLIGILFQKLAASNDGAGLCRNNTGRV